MTTPREKKIYDEKIQSVLADIQALVEKHGCLFTFDPMNVCLHVSFHKNPKVVDQLKQVIEKRWLVSFVSSQQTPDYEVRSPEMQKAIDAQEKMEKLQMILDPMETLGIMTRIASGENIDDVLVEYDEKIQAHEAKIRAIDDDPSKLLADFNFDEDEKHLPDDQSL
jgi:uncharacterized protein YqgV (UPF0045/DUF77 family)